MDGAVDAIHVAPWRSAFGNIARECVHSLGTSQPQVSLAEEWAIRHVFSPLLRSSGCWLAAMSCHGAIRERRGLSWQTTHRLGNRASETRRDENSLDMRVRSRPVTAVGWK